MAGGRLLIRPSFGLCGVACWKLRRRPNVVSDGASAGPFNNEALCCRREQESSARGGRDRRVSMARNISYKLWWKSGVWKVLESNRQAGKGYVWLRPGAEREKLQQSSSCVFLTKRYVGGKQERLLPARQRAARRVHSQRGERRQRPSSSMPAGVQIRMHRAAPPMG